MKRMTFRHIILILILFFSVGKVYGYNVVYTNINGEPVKWDNSQTIRYYVDLQPFNPEVISQEQWLTLLQEAMKLWESVPSAKVPHFEFAGFLPENVTKDNYEKYTDFKKCYTERWEYCERPDLREDLTTLIIIDDGNWLLDHLLTIGGASAEAGFLTLEESSFLEVTKVLQGYIVFGHSPAFDTGGGVAWFAHEIGHLLGLGHTTLNEQLIYTDPLSLGIDWKLYSPTMQTDWASSYLFSYGATLNPDDVAGISMLYPSDTFHSETAKIKGTVKKADGSPMPQVNVVARDISDSLCKVYSFLTSRYCPHPLTSLSWTCLEPNGDYVIEGLPLGNYTLEVEEIIDEPYSLGVLYPEIAGDSEFWNEGDQASEDQYKYTVISLAAGETRENVDIILNRSEVTEDRVKFIPLDVLLANFPLPATTACTDTTIDYAGLIGKDEGGDENPTSAGCSLIIRK